MVLELQELINNPWGSSIGEAQNPEKPELNLDFKICNSSFLLLRVLLKNPAAGGGKKES